MLQLTIMLNTITFGLRKKGNKFAFGKEENRDSPRKLPSCDKGFVRRKRQIVQGIFNGIKELSSSSREYTKTSISGRFSASKRKEKTKIERKDIVRGGGQ